jgi:hypothetical protein
LGAQRKVGDAARLVGILALAGVLRAWHLDFGLPQIWHPDEAESVPAIRDLLAGVTHMGHYRHPPLLKYLAAALLWPWAAPTEAQVVFALRSVSAVAGTLEVGLTWLLARSWLDSAGARRAAALHAVLPLAVFCSKYGVPDALQAALTTAGLCAALALAQAPGVRVAALTGVVVGLAIAAKYVGALLVFPVLVALVLARAAEERPPMAALVGACGAGLVLGLLVGLPTALAEAEVASRAIGQEWRHVMVSERGALGAERGWPGVWHLVHSALPAGGPVLVGMMLGGAALAARRRGGPELVLLAFVLPAYMLFEVANKIPVGGARYVLPLVAPGVVLAGIAADATGRAAWAWAAAAAFPAWRVLRLLLAMEEDTRAEMVRWIEAHDVRGAVVVDLARSGYIPDLSESRVVVERFPEPGSSAPRRRARWALVSSLSWERHLAPAMAETERGVWYRELLSKEPVYEARPDYMTYLFHDPVLRLVALDPETEEAP